MPDFTIDPGDVRAHAKTLIDSVAPAYASSSASVRDGAHINAPGFGLLFFWLEAMYYQKVDFLAKDLQGAHDVCVEIGDRLRQTADQFERAEDLNVAGFQGHPVPAEDYLTALGQTSFVNLDTAGAAVSVLAGVPVAMIYAALASMDLTSAVCPAFIPAAILGATLVANPPGIASAASHLIREGQHLQTQLNANYAQVSGNAAASWTGLGKDSFQELTTTIKGHLDQIGQYLQQLGTALNTYLIVLSGAWLAIAEMIGPFLVWCLAMKAAEVFPPDFPVIEGVINLAGAAMTANVMTIVQVVTAATGVALTIITGLLKDALSLSTLPDGGQAGVPDLTEITIDRNFVTKL